MRHFNTDLSYFCFWVLAGLGYVCVSLKHLSCFWPGGILPGDENALALWEHQPVKPVAMLYFSESADLLLGVDEVLILEYMGLHGCAWVCLAFWGGFSVTEVWVWGHEGHTMGCSWASCRSFPGKLVGDTPESREQTDLCPSCPCVCSWANFWGPAWTQPVQLYVVPLWMCWLSYTLHDGFAWLYTLCTGIWSSR